MVLSLPLKRTRSVLMLINAPAVVSVLVVIVLLDMSPVAATYGADTDPDVDIDPPVIDPVAVIVELDEMVFTSNITLRCRDASVKICNISKSYLRFR